MDWDNQVIVPVTLWGSSQVRHQVSCTCVTPDFKHVVTGSWDGNLVIWTFNATEQPKLAPRWIVSGQTSAVSTICCYNNFVVACFMDGSICHYQLPVGFALKKTLDDAFIHTHSRPLDERQIILAGYYPDLFIIDAFTLEKTVFLQSREQADWVSCVRSFLKDGFIQVQAITTSGFLKTWSLGDTNDGVCLENSLGPLGVHHAKAMSFHMENRWLLLVTTLQVLVFDVGINVIWKHTTSRALEGGDFIGDRVVFWTKSGDLFQCDLKNKGIQQLLKGDSSEIYVPGNGLIGVDNEKYFVVADFRGVVTIWRLTVEDSVRAELVATADSSTSPTSDGLIGHIGVSALCSVHISHLNKLISGCSDGFIRIFSVTELLLAHFFKLKKPDYCQLSGHSGPVRCLLYPHMEDPEYAEHLLVSGGDDFSVGLWDIFKKTLIHRFCVHSGPVVRLLTPPPASSNRVANSICSVSVDHSVAILSIRDRKCAFLASQHPFPIVAVRWKPCHDFLVIKCLDGSVFVWEVGTGVLDRMLCGVAGEEVVYRCDEGNDNVLYDFYTAGPTCDELPRRILHAAPVRKDRSPVQLSGVLTHPHSEAFVLLFNINSLCSHLETIFPQPGSTIDVFSKLHALTKPADPSDLQRAISNVLDSIKHEAENFQEKFHLSIVPKESLVKAAPQRKFSSVSGTQLIPFAQIFLSLVHDWGKKPEIDELISNKLGLIRPQTLERSFDVVSETGSISLRHPQNVQKVHTSWETAGAKSLINVLGRFSFSSSSSEAGLSDWQALVDHLDQLPCSEDLTFVDKLAAVWHTDTLFIRNVVKMVLPGLLNLNGGYFYCKWEKYLPTTFSQLRDHLSRISLVICGLLSIERKLQHDFLERTVACLKFSVKCRGASPALVGAVIDLIGRGFHIWEHLISVDVAVLSIFERCSEFSDPDITMTSWTTLVTIARAKPSQFIAYLKFLSKTNHIIFEDSKPEIVCVLKALIVDARPTFLPLLSEMVEILVACIDMSHMRDAELNALLGVWLPEVHHNTAGQKIVVGLPDGKIVVHELRHKRAHVFPAHDDTPIFAVRFSPDGKNLIAVCGTGEASLWQLSHGIFDLGQFKLRRTRNFPTVISSSPNLKAININWIENKSIMIEAITDMHTPSVVVTLNI